MAAPSHLIFSKYSEGDMDHKMSDTAHEIIGLIGGYLGWNPMSVEVLSETEASSQKSGTGEKLHVSILDDAAVMCRYVDTHNFEHAKMVLLNDDPAKKISEFIEGLVREADVLHI